MDLKRGIDQAAAAATEELKKLSIFRDSNSTG